MEMSHLLGKNYALETVAHRLGLKTSKAREVTQALLKLGHLKQISATEMIKSAEYYVNGNLKDRDAAINYTLQSADKLPNFLKQNEGTDRYYYSALIALDEKTIDYAKNELSLFFSKLNQEIEKNKKI